VINLVSRRDGEYSSSDLHAELCPRVHSETVVVDSGCKYERSTQGQRKQMPTGKRWLDLLDRHSQARRKSQSHRHTSEKRHVGTAVDGTFARLIGNPYGERQSHHERGHQGSNPKGNDERNQVVVRVHRPFDSIKAPRALGISRANIAKKASPDPP